jgi:hypothetical protein
VASDLGFRSDCSGNALCPSALALCTSAPPCAIGASISGSVEAVAQQCAITRAALGKLELGQNPNPTFETLWRYASALDH